MSKCTNAFTQETVHAPPALPLAASNYTARFLALIRGFAPVSLSYFNLFQRSDMNSIIYIIILTCFEID